MKNLSNYSDSCMQSYDLNCYNGVFHTRSLQHQHLRQVLESSKAKKKKKKNTYLHENLNQMGSVMWNHVIITVCQMPSHYIYRLYCFCILAFISSINYLFKALHPTEEEPPRKINVSSTSLLQKCPPFKSWLHLWHQRIHIRHPRVKLNRYCRDLDLFVVLRRVQQPGSYCDG